MENFEYYTPTKVVFGKGAETETGKLVKAQGCRKVLVHYGSNSAEKSGLLERIFCSLGEAGIPYVSLGGVVPNPRLSLVYKGIELCRREGVDFILAVGGGSVIDSAKAIGYGAANEGDVWDFYAKKRTADGCLPIGVVLTISAAGSEMSNSSVITNEEGWLKRGYKTDFARPRFAVMNPELTMTLPAYQTASGCVDIMMHTMERYFNQSANMELTDGISEHLIRTVMKNAAEIRARVATKYIVPDVECTSGTLLFNRSLTSAQMSEKENDEYIVKYEMVVSRINDEGTSVGYIITATCTDGVVFDPSLIQSPQGFTKPYYAESDTEMLYPVYVERVERNDTEIPYLVSLHFWYNEQIFVFSTGITTLNDTYYGVDILLKEIDALVL